MSKKAEEVESEEIVTSGLAQMEEIEPPSIAAASASESAVIRKQVGWVFMLEVVSIQQKSRFFSFHPTVDAAIMELKEHGGRPWKMRDGVRTGLGQLVFDAMQGDGLALIGQFQMVDVQPLVAIAPASALVTLT